MVVIWSHRSLEDLLSIREYISISNPINGENFVSVLLNSVEYRLEQFPYYGRKILELNQENYREIIYGNYRAMYKIEEKQISVITIRNSSQLFSKEWIKD